MSLYLNPMKTSLRLFLSLLFCAASASSLCAADSDLEIHSAPLKIDSTTTKSSEGGANHTKEHWVYQLTIENKNFHDLTGLQVKYVILHTRERLGERDNSARPERKTGSFSIPTLKSREKLTFKTDALELHKASLVGNYIYSSGAKHNAQDALVGVVLRVEQNGQRFAEFANPSNLSKEPVE